MWSESAVASAATGTDRNRLRRVSRQIADGNALFRRGVSDDSVWARIRRWRERSIDHRSSIFIFGLKRLNRLWQHSPTLLVAGAISVTRSIPTTATSRFLARFICRHPVPDDSISTTRGVNGSEYARRGARTTPAIHGGDTTSANSGEWLNALLIHPEMIRRARLVIGMMPLWAYDDTA